VPTHRRLSLEARSRSQITKATLADLEHFTGIEQSYGPENQNNYTCILKQVKTVLS